MEDITEFSDYSLFVDFVEQNADLSYESEYSLCGPCPNCGGDDRFYINFEEDVFCSCRKCKGYARDIAQFCANFLGKSWPEACKVSKEIGYKPRPRTEKQPKTIAIDSAKWQAQAKHAANLWHAQLLNKPELLEFLEQRRGITRATINEWKLGYHAYTTYQAAAWGFPDNFGELGVLPGITIPHFRPDGSLLCINTRLFKPTDKLPPKYLPAEQPKPPYFRLKGSQSLPWVLTGEPCCFLHNQFNEPCAAHESDPDMNHRPVIIVESELDALLLWQQLKQYVTPVAMLSASAKAKPATLPPGPVLFAMDRDKAGKINFPWWRKNFNAVPAWPIGGKDVTDMVISGVNLLDWLAYALKQNNLLEPNILNPYAHFNLLCRNQTRVEQGTNAIWGGDQWVNRDSLSLPKHILSECSGTGTIHQWHMTCNLTTRRQLQIQYLRMWGLTA